MCRTFVPDDVVTALDPIKGDDAAVKEYGIQLAVEMIKKLWATGVRGFHFCTLNLERSVSTILHELGWLQGSALQAVKQVSRHYRLVEMR